MRGKGRPPSVRRKIPIYYYYENKIVGSLIALCSAVQLELDSCVRAHFHPTCPNNPSFSLFINILDLRSPSFCFYKSHALGQPMPLPLAFPFLCLLLVFHLPFLCFHLLKYSASAALFPVLSSLPPPLFSSSCLRRRKLPSVPPPIPLELG